MGTKAILARVLALAGMAACAYCVVAAFMLGRFHDEIGDRVKRWCKEEPTCESALFVSSLEEPIIRVKLKPSRKPTKADVLLADLREANVFARPEDSAWPMFKTREPRVVVQ